MVARIDALKGELVPREAYVRRLLEKALKAEERKRASDEHSPGEGQVARQVPRRR
jgi:hypothetical protein